MLVLQSIMLMQKLMMVHDGLIVLAMSTILMMAGVMAQITTKVVPMMVVTAASLLV